MSLGPTYPYSVEALVSQMERRQTSSNRFALPYTDEGTYSALLAAVKGEVAARNREFVMSEAVDDRLKKISAWLNDPKGRFGLMLGGTCGNGKTTFAKAIRKLFDDLQLRNCYNITVTARFLTSKDLLQMCVNAPDKWEEICLAPILIIDDLGEEPLEIESFRNVLTPIVDLITKRYDRLLFTIVTTNLQPPDIVEKYGERIADRLAEMMECIGFDTPSYRYLPK